MALIGVYFSIIFTFGPALGATLLNVIIVAANPFATAVGFSLFLIVIETIYLYIYLPKTLLVALTNPTASGSATKNKPVNSCVRTNSYTLLNFTYFAFILFFTSIEFSLLFITYNLFFYRSA
jgi:hypothetical protein